MVEQTERNRAIYEAHQAGDGIRTIAERHKLSDGRIRDIIRAVELRIAKEA